ncbi:MAG: hypothetical protein V8Q27_05915 [Eubacteriales bacterium]
MDFEDIYTEGITKVTAEDIQYADKLRRVIKLLAMSKKEADGKYYAMVAPFLIDAANPLYNVNGVLNAIFVEGNMRRFQCLWKRGRKASDCQRCSCRCGGRMREPERESGLLLERGSWCWAIPKI